MSSPGRVGSGEIAWEGRGGRLPRSRRRAPIASSLGALCKHRGRRRTRWSVWFFTSWVGADYASAECRRRVVRSRRSGGRSLGPRR
jgi:hypothetical protein